MPQPPLTGRLCLYTNMDRSAGCGPQDAAASETKNVVDGVRIEMLVLP